MALYLPLRRLVHGVHGVHGVRDGRRRHRAGHRCGACHRARRRHRAGQRCRACHRGRRWRRYWCRHHARRCHRWRCRCRRRDGDGRHACRDWCRRYGSGRDRRSCRRSGSGSSGRNSSGRNSSGSGRCGRRRRWRRGRQRFCHRHRRSHAIGRRCRGGHGALRWRARLARQAVVAALGLGQRPHHGRRHGGQDSLGRCRRGCANRRCNCLAWRCRPRWRSRWHAGLCCHSRGRQTVCQGQGLGLCHWRGSACLYLHRRRRRCGCRCRRSCRRGHGGRRWSGNGRRRPQRLGEQGQRGGRGIGKPGQARVDRCQHRRRSAVRCRCGRCHTKIHDHA